MQEDAGSNLLQNWIARAALAAPGKPWVVSADDDRTVSYGELHETVGRFASLLCERGLGPNDRVSLLVVTGRLVALIKCGRAFLLIEQLDLARP